MSNKVILVWGGLVVVIISTILLLGYKFNGEIEYVKMKQSIRNSVYNYIGDNDVKFPLEISTEKLEEENYLEEIRIGNKLCAADVVVNKKFVIYNYDISFTCVDVT